MTRSRNVFRGSRPAPYMGVDFRIPITQMPPEYSPFMTNFFVDNGRISLRPGHSQAQTTSVTTSTGTIAIPHFDGSDFEPITISSGGASGKTKTSAGEVTTSTKVSAPECDWMYWQDKILIAGSDTVVELDHTVPSYTNRGTFTSTGTTTRRGICNYRERMYVAEGKELKYWGVGAFAGAATTFDLTYLINGDLCECASFSFVQGFSLEQFLVLCSTTGDVLIYSGSYPGGADWTIVQKFKIDMPAGGPNFPIELIDIPNDLLLNPKYGYQMYSVKELLLNGGNAVNYAPLEPLTPFYQSVAPITSASFGGAEFLGRKTAAYWPKQNKLCIVQDIFGHDLGLMQDWSSYVNVFDATTYYTLTIAFLVDLSTGAVTMHTFHTDAVNTAYIATAGQLRSGTNRLMMPGIDRSVYLFTPAVTIASLDYYQDFAAFNIESIALFAPLTGNGYRNKAPKKWAMYSDMYDVHQDQFFTMSNADFNTAPGTFEEFNTNYTTREVRAHILPGGNFGSSVIFGIKQGGENAYPFEVLGIDPIFEEGGEY